MISGPCIFKRVCGASSEGCSLVHLVDYCQPIFISSNGNSSCSVCGEYAVCFPVNDHTKACQECMTGYIFQRMAQEIGIDHEKVQEISNRIRS